MNENTIYRRVIDKYCTKSKYLLSNLLKRLYNMLKERDNLGASDKFTSIFEAIFFFLNTERIIDGTTTLSC